MPANTNAALDRLVDALGRLPGVGAKSAERLAHHLLKAPAEEALALAEAIRGAKQDVGTCTLCYHLTEADQPLCPICRDSRRDKGLLCVVETSRDLLALEKSGTYGGVYHVLGRFAPLQGYNVDQLTLEPLADRVAEGNIRELILATNPNLEGDGAAMLVAARLENAGVPISRLARGLASGSSLEFANKEMLADALAGRRAF